MGTHLDVLPVLHHHHVHLIDDENLNRREEVRVPAAIRQQVITGKKEDVTHFSFSILVLNPRGLATMTSQL